MPGRTAAEDAIYKRGIRQAIARTIDALKVSAGCADCGFSAHPAALHFDHVDPATKRRELGWFDCRGDVKSYPRLARYLAHVDAYCEVRCANCHAIRTMTEGHHLTRRTTATRTQDTDALF